MRYLTKILAVVIFFNLNLITVRIQAQQVFDPDTSLIKLSFPEQEALDTLSLNNDSALNKIFFSDLNSVDTILHRDTIISKPKVYNYVYFTNTTPDDSIINFVDQQTFRHRTDSLMSIPLTRSDSLQSVSNSLFLPLIYQRIQNDPIWDRNLHLTEKFYGNKKDITKLVAPQHLSKTEIIDDLRLKARRYISNNAVLLYVTTWDRLPALSSFMSRQIQGREVSALTIYDNKIDLGKPKIDIGDINRMFWIKKANAMLQFSQNHVSKNWHQGGNSNLAFLSIVNAELNYDNQKNVIWENRLEWRIGFNKIQSEKALRNLNINDDIMRYNSKFGLKAGGNWYYSVSGEVATQLFDNYRAFDSEVFKARIFTPVRVNVGVGMDFKYKKSFSLMIAPVAFKYIYLQDTVTVNPNLFGLKKGENQLRQIGSSLRAQSNLKPADNWNIDSRLTFYTDYKKVEIDFEIVNNFVINRFLTTRLSINPRFDNTIILKEGEKSKIQFKELLSIGFSYRFI